MSRADRLDGAVGARLLAASYAVAGCPCPRAARPPPWRDERALPPPRRPRALTVARPRARRSARSFAFASFPLCFVMSSAVGGTRGARIQLHGSWRRGRQSVRSDAAPSSTRALRLCSAACYRDRREEHAGVPPRPSPPRARSRPLFTACTPCGVVRRERIAAPSAQRGWPTWLRPRTRFLLRSARLGTARGASHRRGLTDAVRRPARDYNLHLLPAAAQGSYCAACVRQLRAPPDWCPWRLATGSRSACAAGIAFADRQLWAAARCLRGLADAGDASLEWQYSPRRTSRGRI